MVAYWQLRVVLWRHGKASERATSWPLVLQAATAAWTIVDDIHRIGVLVPGLKRGPAVTALLKAADQVEAPRNAVQHLDGEIEELLDSGRPVWGSLSWVNMASPDAKRLSVGLLLPGTLAPTHGVPVVNPLGREIELPIGLAMLTAAGMTVCLGHVCRCGRAVLRPPGAGSGGGVRHHSRRREQRHRQAQPAHGLAPLLRRATRGLDEEVCPPPV